MSGALKLATTLVTATPKTAHFPQILETRKLLGRLSTQRFGMQSTGWRLECSSVHQMRAKRVLWIVPVSVKGFT